MGLLSKKIKAVKAEVKRVVGAVDGTLPVPTGILPIDYGLASFYRFEDENGEVEKVLVPGMQMGKIALFFGGTGSGKTTIAYQIAWNIARQMNGDVIVFDFERASTNLEGRLLDICEGSTPESLEETFTVFNQSDLDIEFVQQTLKEIAATKRSLAKDKDNLIDWKDEKGKDVKILPPTIVIVDSVATMRTKEVLKDDANNMTGATIARINAEFIKQAMNYLESENITLFGINHVTTKVTINPFEKKDPVIQGLDPKTENLPGGKAWGYFANYGFRMYGDGAKLDPTKDYKIEGREVQFRITKSRSSFNLIRFNLAITGKRGFYGPLCNIFGLGDQVQGTGTTGLYVSTNPDLKWKRNSFLKDLQDESFAKAFEEAMLMKYHELAEKRADSEIVPETPVRGRKAAVEAFEEEFDDEDI